jgi:DNA-binding transcriptional ArsR family regulator
MKEFCNEAYYLIFVTLANRTRLALIDALKEGHKTLPEISRALEQDENIISYNIKPLIKCAIVLSQGAGKEKIYCLNKEFIVELSELLAFHVDKHCPKLKECIPPEKLKEYLKAEAAKTTYIEHE